MSDLNDQTTNQNTDLDNEGAALLKLAVEADAKGLDIGSSVPFMPGEHAPASDSKGQSPEHAEGEGDKPDETGEASESDSKSDDEDGKDVSEPSEDVDSGKKDDDKAKASSKSAKEKARRDRSWKALNAEKEQFQAKIEAYERERAEWQRQKTLEAESARPKAEEGDPSEYERLAEKYEAEGEERYAKVAREKAKHLREQQRLNEEKRQREEFDRKWRENLTKAVEENPDLKDEKTPLHKAVANILHNRPVLNSYSDGITDAVEVAKAVVKASQVDELQKLVEAQKQQIADLNEKLSVGSAPDAPAPSGGKSFDSMNLAEQEKFLRKQAEEMDRLGQAAFAWRPGG